MKLTRTAIILGGIACGATTFLGSGAAQAASDPVTVTGDIVAKTIDTPNPDGWVHEIVKCDAAHPFLVLDNSSDNDSRIFRHATFNTGDNESLSPFRKYFETIAPGPSFKPNFTEAAVAVQLEGSEGRRGHKSVTVYCASTLEAAHQM